MTPDSLDQTLETYRKQIEFTKTGNISHPVDCYPDSCSLVGYVTEDGTLAYQEQMGRYPVVDPSTPDWNPRGCSRQCSFTDATYGQERIEQPMIQTGERGSDNWEPITWEEAYERIASEVVDAIEDHPQSIVAEQPPLNGGNVHGVMPIGVLMQQLGGVFIDMDALVGDCFPGQVMTFGKMHMASTHDDWFNADVVLIWHANPAYSRNPSYHFLTEMRYNGGQLITIAPDYSPSAIHADRYVPVEPASDAALCLGIARVILEADLLDREFVREQTDLPVLVREDTGKYLRESDLEDDGADDVVYVWDVETGLQTDPRETLELGDLEPALEGSYEVEIDGRAVSATPVLELVRERLEADYDLATVEAITGVAPTVVRELAETIATNRTAILNSFNLGKTFHGDLIERGMALVLGLTGNWGRPGTGMRGWTGVAEPTLGYRPRDPVLDHAIREQAERELTDEEVARRVQNTMLKLVPGLIVPAVWWWHRHCGYDEVWEEVSLEDAEIPRTPAEYIEEAEESGWWDGIDSPAADVEPNVLFLCGSNTIRRTRGGSRVLLEELWPTLEQIVCIDYRWSTTALHSDIVLPAAFHHEKEQFDSMVVPEARFLAYSDKLIEPRHDTRTELEMVAGIVTKIEEEAASRGLERYEVPHGLTVEAFNDALDMANTDIGELPSLPGNLAESVGRHRSYETIYERMFGEFFGMKGWEERRDRFSDDQMTSILEGIIEQCVDNGVFGEDLDLETFKERGVAMYEGLGDSTPGLQQAASMDSDRTVVALDKHTVDKQPYPTEIGRTQFYIDHDWFLEADEALPRHKRPPAVHGGDRDRYPFVITSGHNRHSTQGTTLASDVQMNQHRGEPHVFINPHAAAELDIEDGDLVRLWNDFGSFTIQAKVSALTSERQLIIYHAWDEYLFEEGKGHHHLTPGIIKPLHLAGGFAQFEYHSMNWEPQQHDRHVSVAVEPVQTD